MKTITYDETQWKLVPVEPTQDMIYEGVEVAGCLTRMIAAGVYRAMLAAAPEAPEYRGIRSQDNEKAPEIVDITTPILDHASIEGMDDTAGLPPILKKQAS